MISDGLFTENARTCALRSLYERYGVNAPILEWIPASERATVLNYAAKYVGHKPMQCPVVYGKINAFLSNTYTPFPAYKLFEKISAIESVDAASGFQGYWNYEGCEAVYRLSTKKKLGDNEFPVSMRIRTSDIGESSVSFRGEIWNGRYSVPIMSDVFIVHKGSNVEASIDQMVESVDYIINNNLLKLARLMTIPVENPTACAKRAAKYAHLPKRMALEILQNWEPDVHTTSAFDVYMTLSEVIEKAPGEKEKIRSGGDLAKLIGANWNDFDLPGEFAW